MPRGLQRFDTYAEIEEIMKSPDSVPAGAEESTVFLEGPRILSAGRRHNELKQLFAPRMSRDAIAYDELHLVEPVVQQAIAAMHSHRGPDGIAHGPRHRRSMA